MSLYAIITALQQEPSSNAKLEILEANKENELLREYLRVTHSPQINFYVSEKTFPEYMPHSEVELIDEFYWMLLDLAEDFSTRKISGNAMADVIARQIGLMDSDIASLFKMMLLKDIKAGIGPKQINKIWPNLIPVQPYMRCSLPSDVDTSKWDWKAGVFSQVKADGMYCAISNNKAITRNGNCFDIGSFNENLQHEIKEIPEGVELNGELVVYLRGSDTPLDRKTSNGLLNSLLKSGEKLGENYELKYFVWDYQSPDSADKVYSKRFWNLAHMVGYMENIECVGTDVCFEQESAQDHLKRCLALGLEGTVLKNPKGLWKDGTSKDIVKNKIVADVDLLCCDVYEGTGKAKGKMGGLCLRSSDSIVQVNVGTGFTDIQREVYWKHPPIGCIVHITANDLVQDKRTKAYSLFLPSFQEIRTDKNEADDFQKIKAIINNAKGIA